MIVHQFCSPAGGKGRCFSGWDRLIAGNHVRSVLIFKDQLYKNNEHPLYFSDLLKKTHAQGMFDRILKNDAFASCNAS